jgi:hypothetical protein
MGYSPAPAETNDHMVSEDAGTVPRTMLSVTSVASEMRVSLLSRCA